jgi:mono/diheme cytochrome c family protein
MRQLRVLLTVLVTAILLGVVLAGCSGGSATSGDAGAGSAEEESEAVQDTEEPTEIPPRDYEVPAEEASRENPIPADDANLQRGREIYESSCIDCHGEQGRGDGPTASRLNPPPVDFQASHILELSDGELFYIIANSVEGTAMPKFNYLDEEQRWQLVLHIRQLQQE